MRGWNRTDRERARALRERLSHHAVDTVELSPVPEAEERHRTPGGRRRPRVDLLVHAGGSQGEQARRAAALWRLPLLIEREDGDGEGGLNAFGAHRRAAIGVRLTGGGFDVAVREVTLVSLQPQAGHAHLILDNEKVTAPADRPLTAGLTPDGMLEVRGDTFGAPAGCGACAMNARGASAALTSTAPRPTTCAPRCAWKPCPAACICCTRERSGTPSGVWPRVARGNERRGRGRRFTSLTRRPAAS